MNISLKLVLNFAPVKQYINILIALLEYDSKAKPKFNCKLALCIKLDDVSILTFSDDSNVRRCNDMGNVVAKATIETVTKRIFICRSLFNLKAIVSLSRIFLAFLLCFMLDVIMITLQMKSMLMRRKE